MPTLLIVRKVTRRSEYTYVASIVYILRVPSSRHGRIIRNAAVDWVDGPEGVYIYF